MKRHQIADFIGSVGAALLIAGYLRYSIQGELLRLNEGLMIAGGVFLVIVIGLVFGIGHMPNQSTQSTTVNNAPPPMTQPAPAGTASRTYSPTPMSPPQTPAPAQPQP